MNRFVEFFRRQPQEPNLDKELAKVVAKHNKDLEGSQRFIKELMLVIVGESEAVSVSIHALTLKNISARDALLSEERVNRVINLLKKIRVLPEDLTDPIHAELKTVKRGLLALDTHARGGDDTFTELGWSKPYVFSNSITRQGSSFQESPEVKRHELLELLKKYKALLLIIHELLFPLAD